MQDLNHRLVRQWLPRFVIFSLLVVSISGCLAVPWVMVGSKAFEEKEPTGDVLKQLQQETAPYLKKGSGTIAGVVTIVANGNTMVAGAGAGVFLTPATTWANWRLQHFVIEDNEVPEKSQAQLAWLTKTDAQGRFDFTDLPPGQYLLLSQVFLAGGSDVAYARVQLGAGEKAEVNVTRVVDAHADWRPSVQPRPLRFAKERHTLDPAGISCTASIDVINVQRERAM